MIRIRCSTLSSYTDCPRRAAVGILRDQIADAGFSFTDRPGNVGAMVGSAVHMAATAMASDKKTTGQDPALIGDYVQAGIEGLRKYLENGAQYDDTTPTTNAAEYQVVKLAGIFHGDILPYLVPENIELRRTGGISDGFELSGQTDIETAGRAVIDVKTGVRAPISAAQLGGYSMLIRAVDGQSPAELRVIHTPRMGLGKKYKGTGTMKYDSPGAEKLAWETVKYIMWSCRNFVSSGNPAAFPFNPSSSICSPKYCRAWGSEWCNGWRFK